MADRERSLLPGVILILLGLYFLLDELQVFYIRWYYVYPLLLLGLGAFFLAAIFTKHDKGAVFPATILLVLGLFYFLRNYGLLPYAFYLYYVEDYWPIFLFAFGLGFLLLFAVRPEEWGLLIPGGILFFLGVIFLLRNLRIFYFRDVAHLWPIILIVIGLGIIVSSLRKPPKEQEP